MIISILFNFIGHYVKNQAEHHETESFKDEVIRLLKEHNVDFIDEYLFT